MSHKSRIRSILSSDDHAKVIASEKPKTKLKFELNGKQIEPPAGEWPEIKMDIDFEHKQFHGSYADDEREEETK